jgi:transposase
LLDQLRAQILTMSNSVLPKSAAGKARSYTLALWQKLTRFMEHPELELSNNLAENSMRPVSLGRENPAIIAAASLDRSVAATEVSEFSLEKKGRF